MFSKALFKQSCKANGTMWTIITFAVCFMLACVMLISGNGNIGDVKNAIEDTIITKEIDAQLEKRAINYYSNADDGLNQFDYYFTLNATDDLSYLVYLNAKPDQNNYSSTEDYQQALLIWSQSAPEMKTTEGKNYVNSINTWLNSMPQQDQYTSTQDYLEAIKKWKEETPSSQEKAIASSYIVAINELQEYIYNKALEINSTYTKDSLETQEMLGSVMYSLNPNGMFNEFYSSHNEDIPEDYDIMSIIAHLQTNDALDYIKSEERVSYRSIRSENGASVFLSGNMTEEENVNKIIDELSSFGVTKEKYDSFGYTYTNIKHLSKTAIITYKNRLAYELDLLKDKYNNGEFTSQEEYQQAIRDKTNELSSEVASSLLASLPEKVSEALEDIGKADLYTLIVGSIFYKLAGLLLPIIFMIMVSNNLISGQVDSGSMAYVLSTSTKRKTVSFTQAVYLIGSLLTMFILTTITGSVCLAIVGDKVSLTYGKFILLNVGAFLVLFCLSGLCFFTSCYFDRSKRSMAIGGGLSIFALVAAMLGLFGSQAIPSVVRLDSLNYFNYVTIISLFDVISIINNSTKFIYKFVILFVLGVIGYIVGSIKFRKKDLPL